MKIRNGMQGLLTSSMMTPMERAAGRFMRAPDGHGGGGGGGKELTQADVDKAVEAALAKVNDKLEELQSKNTGLLDDLKKAQREARAAKEIKPEDLAAAEDRAEKAEAELATARKDAKDAKTAAEKAAKALETESGFTSKLLIQDGIKSALIAAGVKDEDHLDVLAAKFGSGATVKVDGETRTALIGDKPLADFFKDWSGTETAKKYISAPANGGGGAPGSKGGGSGKTMTSASFNALQPKARAEFMAEGGALTD